MITVHHLENSRSQRVLWLLEDAHWIDPTTLELVTRAAARAAERALGPAACSLGPTTVARDRFDYSSSISESWKRWAKTAVSTRCPKSACSGLWAPKRPVYMAELVR